MSSLAVEEQARIYLNVPFKEKGDANKMGAKWDSDEKSWFTLENNPNNKALMEKWGKEVVPQVEAKQVQAKAPIAEADNSPRIYLDVPFKEKDDASNLGAKWDDTQKSWFTLQNNPNNKELFTNWSIRLEEVPKVATKQEQVQEQTKAPTIAPENSPRIYLNVPRTEKDDASKLGAKWDGKEVSWYTTESNPKNNELFTKWQPSERGFASTQFEKLKDVFENANSLQELLKSKDKAEVIEALKVITDTVTPAPKAEAKEKTSSRMKM